EADARKLAETLVGIGARFDKPTVALLTGMDAPLGRAVGNWPETAEAVRVLRGETPAGGPADDLLEVTLALAGEMVHLGGQADSPEAGREKAKHALDGGHAFETWVALVEAQGGDVSVLDDPDSREGSAPVAEIRAPDDVEGFVSRIHPLALGPAAAHLRPGH